MSDYHSNRDNSIRSKWGKTMMRIGGLILSVLAITGLAKADNSFSEIELTSFEDIPSIYEACDAPVQNVGYSNNRNCRRFYITGLWGPSAATLYGNNIADVNSGPYSDSENIFNAGIAAGFSFERQQGRLRLEAEWLQRDFFAAPFNNDPAGPIRVIATDNWSVMVNLWRDVMLTNEFGCYGGGGIGGGGLQVGYQSLGDSGPFETFSGTAFAWQAGGGLIYELSDQITFDVSYRYYQLNDWTNLVAAPPSLQTVGFGASQVMFSLRIFEPFRTLFR